MYSMTNQTVYHCSFCKITTDDETDFSERYETIYYNDGVSRAILCLSCGRSMTQENNIKN